MVAHTFNLVLGGRGRQVSEFNVSLVSKTIEKRKIRGKNKTVEGWEDVSVGKSFCKPNDLYLDL